jgi:hypothetical protein
MDITESEMNEMVHAMADVIDRIRKECNEPPIDRNRLNQIIEDRVLSEYGITVVC